MIKVRSVVKISWLGLVVGMVLWTTAVFAQPNYADGAHRKPQACGTATNARGFTFKIRVTKGAIRCPAARQATFKFFKATRCGTQMIPSCVVNTFRCRIAAPGESARLGVAGYCYRLKRPIPAHRDLTYYTPDKFKAAFVLRLVR